MDQPHREPLDFWSPLKPSLTTCHIPWVDAMSPQVDGNFSKHSAWLIFHGSSGFESHFNLWESELSDFPHSHIWTDPKLESFGENLPPFATIVLKCSLECWQECTPLLEVKETSVQMLFDVTWIIWHQCMVNICPLFIDLLSFFWLPCSCLVPVSPTCLILSPPICVTLGIPLTPFWSRTMRLRSYIVIDCNPINQIPTLIKINKLLNAWLAPLSYL